MLSLHCAITTAVSIKNRNKLPGSDDNVNSQVPIPFLFETGGYCESGVVPVRRLQLKFVGAVVYITMKLWARLAS